MPTLGIFAKRPLSGAVKTRLAASVGDEAAARFYEVCLKTLFKRLRNVDLRRVIAVAGSVTETASSDGAEKNAPSSYFEWFQQFEAFDLWLQPGGDLGQKLASWFDDACMSDDHVLVIGSDSPTLPLEFINDAVQKLQTHDCVIGPALDGGYYLLGLRRPVPELFQGIEWSGPRVCEQTLQRAASQGLSVFQLPPWNDVDELADLQELGKQLDATTGDPDWAALRSVVHELLRTSRGVSPALIPYNSVPRKTNIATEK